MAKEVECETHGRQGFSMACTHVAHAIDDGTNVGFFWSDRDDDGARPDAWCLACERALVALGDDLDAYEAWFRAAEFKILCAACWDDAKRVLYRPSRS